MSQGLVTYSDSGAYQLVDTHIYNKVVYSGTSTTVTSNYNGYETYSLYIPGEYLSDERWIVIRNIDQGTEVSYQVFMNYFLSDMYYSTLNGVNSTVIRVPYSGSYSWAVLSNKSWLDSQDYGLSIYTPSGSVAFTSSEANFGITDVISILLTGDLVPLNSSILQNYTINTGNRALGNLFYRPIVFSTIILDNSSRTIAYWYKVSYRIINYNTLSLRITNFSSTNYSSNYPQTAASTPSTIIRVLIGYLI